MFLSIGSVDASIMMPVAPKRIARMTGSSPAPWSRWKQTGTLALAAAASTIGER